MTEYYNRSREIIAAMLFLWPNQSDHTSIGPIGGMQQLAEIDPVTSHAVHVGNMTHFLSQEAATFLERAPPFPRYILQGWIWFYQEPVPQMFLEHHKNSGGSK